VTLKVFGTKGASSDVVIEKLENRFDRNSTDSFMVGFFSSKFNLTIVSLSFRFFEDRTRRHWLTEKDPGLTRR
jgi:hypothetical protein